MYLHVLHRFPHQLCQASVHLGTRAALVDGPVWPEVADHQVEVVPLQPPQPQGLPDGADLRQTHPPLLKLCCLLFQPENTSVKAKAFYFLKWECFICLVYKRLYL